VDEDQGFRVIAVRNGWATALKYLIVRPSLVFIYHALITKWFGLVSSGATSETLLLPLQDMAGLGGRGQGRISGFSCFFLSERGKKKIFRGIFRTCRPCCEIFTH
jgi:hypothetical protein